MRELGVETLDQLAETLSETKPEAVREAKLVMCAFFFSLEESAVEFAYANYAEFFREMFQYGRGHLLEDRAKATPCRVITYNYDRLFERTCIKWARREELGNEEMTSNLDGYVKKFLNLGFLDPHGITVDPNRFSFLKLHGGIGQFHRDDYGLDYPYWPKFGERLPVLNDEPYYKRNGYESSEPTIAFPWDKKNRRPIQRPDPFRRYLDTVEQQAKAFCQSAAEIQIIGYSMQDIDAFTFKALIAEAKNCKTVIVRNRLSEKRRFLRKLEGIKEEFGAKWTVDFKEEDFFAREVQASTA